LEHYYCIVDLLGRAGHLDDAVDLIKMMPCEPSGSVWKALLGACRIHGNVEMGECIAKKVLELEPGNSAGYVPLANIYAAAGK
jgi:pentatricopeptide repeat protein